MGNHNISRRGFLGLTAGATIGVAASPLLGSGTAMAAMGVAAPDVPSQALGLQLFTVRDVIRSQGFRKVFEALAAMGYKEVEFAGYTQDTGILGRQITIQEIRQALDDNGLVAVGSHIGAQALLDPDQRNASFEIGQTLGMKYIGTANDIPGGIRASDGKPYATGQTVADMQRAAALFSDAAVAAKAYNIQGVYQHNHQNEFRFTSDDITKRRYDVFANNIDYSTGAFLEMDICWAYEGARVYPGPTGAVAPYLGPGEGMRRPGFPDPDYQFGFDPADYVVANPNRYHLFHTKDGVPNVVTNPATTTPWNLVPVEFDTGIIDFRAFYKKIGAKTEQHSLYEQDTATNAGVPGGSLGATQRSFDAMFVMRTKTWLDELVSMVTRFNGEGRISNHTTDGLLDRLEHAITRYDAGSEKGAMGYLSQFIARVNNQVRNEEAVRARLTADAQVVIDWLAESDEKEGF
jgi:sugar phosphate isomerase/epimerase